MINRCNAQLKQFLFAFFQRQFKGEFCRGMGKNKLFNLIGMYINKARQNISAMGINGLICCAVKLAEIENAIVIQQQRFSLYNLIRRNNTSVFD